MASVVHRLMPEQMANGEHLAGVVGDVEHLILDGKAPGPTAAKGIGLFGVVGIGGEGGLAEAVDALDLGVGRLRAERQGKWLGDDRGVVAGGGGDEPTFDLAFGEEGVRLPVCDVGGEFADAGSVSF